MQRLARPFVVVGALVASFGCSGAIVDMDMARRDDVGGGGSGGSGGAASCTQTEAGSAPVRRLTRVEYNNTVHDLLGDTTGPAARFQDDAQLGGFDNNAASPLSSATMASDYLGAAEDLAGAVNLDALLPCKPVSVGEEACARQFTASFGRSALRRPLTSDETAGLTKVYIDARTRGNDFTDSVRLVIATILQSASFVNHIERGANPVGAAQSVPLSPYEMASRLSYFLWQSMPDAALFAAAEANRLSTADEVEAQARRMLSSPRARPALMAFYDQWLNLDQLTGDAFDRNKNKVVGYTPDLGSSMRAETLAFVESVVWDGDGRMETLLTAPYSFVNATLARIYRLTGVTGTNLQRINLPSVRAGLLTQAAFLSSAGGHPTPGAATDPIHRGLWVRQKLLCQDVPSPPANLAIKPPPLDPNLTTGQRYMKMLDDAFCLPCHRKMNPIGVGMENFDGMGQYRTTENKLPIDASGDVVDLDPATPHLPFSGLVDLSRKLAGAGQVRDCVARQWLGYASGSFDFEGLTCGAQKVASDFAAGGGNLRDLMVTLVRSDAFRFRGVISKEACK